MTALTKIHTQSGMIRDLQRTMARADDARIAEIVTLVDRLPERSAADALVAPLRARLLQIRPPRRLTVERLLFTPANTVLIPAIHWRRNSVTIPRTALRCLSNQVCAALGDASDIEAEIAGATTMDRARLLRGGAKLWPRAAAILASSSMPPDWAAQTSLAAADYLAIVRPLAALLQAGTAIEALIDAAAAGAPVPRAQLRDCLAHSAESGGGGAKTTQPLGMLIGVLLARMPTPEDVLVAAGDLAHIAQDPSIRGASDLAIDVVLAGSEAMLTDQHDIGIVAAEIRRVSVLLDTLEHPGPAARPARKQELAGLRRNLDASCRKRFGREIETALYAARGHADTPSEGARKPPEDVDIAMLEAAIRDLRDFEAAARGFGGGASYDRAIATAANRLATLPRDPQTGCNVARLIEILDGPEAGLAYLTGNNAPPRATEPSRPPAFRS